MQKQIIEQGDIIINKITQIMQSQSPEAEKQQTVEELQKFLITYNKMVPKTILEQYQDFFQSFLVFCDKCHISGFIDENIDMLLSSLELLIQCMEEIKEQYDTRVKRCICCNSEVAYLPIPEYYKQMEKKYGTINRGIAETLNEEEYLCPDCGASDRDRLIVSYLKKEGLPKAEENYRVLQIAPSKPISNWLNKYCSQIAYETADLYMQDVDFKIDIQNMESIEKDTYDLIICSHVLEHVENDRRALEEIKRILKEDGKCIFLVPVTLGYEEIDEAFGLSSEENWRRFGQGDHCRRYGKNALLDRLSEQFYVNQLGKAYFGDDVFEQGGLTDTSTLYVLTKEKNVSISLLDKHVVDNDLLENGPLVSVIMSCYNHGKFVGEAIESVLKQTYKNIEFVVGDDGSVDDSVEVMKRYSEHFVYAYYSPENTGGLNDYIRHFTRGKYIALMNSDDVWEEDKIARQVEYMEKHAECGVCLTWCMYIDEEDREIQQDTTFIQRNRDSYQWMNYFWKNGNVLCNPSYLARREWGLWSPKYGEACRQLPDFFKWVEMVQKTTIYVMPKVLVHMRKHCSELTENVSAPTQVNSLRHILEEGCNWMWVIRDMEKEFFKKAFKDCMIYPEAETEEEIKCEKYFLLLGSKNFAVQYEALCYFNEIYIDTWECFTKNYHYDYRNAAEDILSKGIGQFFNK